MIRVTGFTLVPRVTEEVLASRWKNGLMNRNRGMEETGTEVRRLCTVHVQKLGSGEVKRNGDAPHFEGGVWLEEKGGDEMEGGADGKGG